MRDPEATRETILKEAGILFNTQGYKATSISRITDATGFTKGAVYRHFENKDQLEKETLIFLSGEMYKRMRDVIRKEKDAVSKLKAVFQYFGSYITNPPLQGGCPLLNAAIEVDDAHPELRKAALRILRTLKGSIATILDNGIKYGQIKEDIDKEFYATIIIAALEGAIMMSKLEGSDEDIKKVITHLDEMISRISV